MRRLVAGVAAAALTGTALAACAESGGDDQIVLTIWANRNGTDAVTEMYEDFSRDNSTYDIEVALRWAGEGQEFIPRWNSGDRPDLIEWHPSQRFMAQIQASETLIPLTDEEFVDRVKFNLYDFSGAIGDVPYYAITAYPTLHAMWYNKTLFGELGLSMPTNAQELLQLCRDVRAQRPDLVPIYVGGGDQWPFYLIPQMFWADTIADGAAERVNSGEAEIVADNWLEPLEFNATDMRQAGCFNEHDLLTATYADQQAAVFDGDALMIPQVSDVMSVLTETYGTKPVNETIGFLPISWTDNKLTWSVQTLGAFAAPKTGDTEREKGALEFLRYATGEGYATLLERSGSLPVLEGFENPDSAPQAMLDAATYFEDNGGVPAFDTAFIADTGEFGALMSQVFAGQSTPAQVTQEMQDTFTRAARATGLPGF